MCGGIIKKIPIAALYDEDNFFDYEQSDDLEEVVFMKSLSINATSPKRR